MRVVGVSIFLLFLSELTVDSFSPWQHIRQHQTWGAPHHLPRRLRQLIARPNSARDDDDETDISPQFADSSPMVDGSLEQQKLQPRRPSIPPPDDLELQPWKPFFIDEKRDTTIEEPFIPVETTPADTTVAIETTEAITPLAENVESAETKPLFAISTTVIEPILDPVTQEEIAKAADLVREKFMSEVIEPCLTQPVKKNVPSDAIRGAALTAATLSLLASKSLIFSGVAGLGAAYVAISSGTVGDSLRVVGTGAWGTAEFLSEFLISSKLLSSVAKVLLTTSIETAQQLAVAIEQASIAYNNATSQRAELERLHAEVEQVLIQAEEAMKVAESAVEVDAVKDETDTSAAELEGATLQTTDDDKAADESEETVKLTDVAKETVEAVTSLVEVFEDVEEMQESLGIASKEDLQELGDIVSEEDMQQEADLFLEQVPIGMEGDDEVVRDRETAMTTAELEGATLQSTVDDKATDEAEVTIDQINVAKEAVEAVTSLVEVFEDVEEMQDSLGITSKQDLQELGNIVSEEDLQQQADMFLEQVPIGMEGDDEVVTDRETVMTAAELEGATLQTTDDDKATDETEETIDQIAVAQETLEAVTSLIEDFEDVEEMQGSLGITSEENLQELGDIVSEEDLQQQADLFLEQVPIGMESDDEVEEATKPVDDFEDVEKMQESLGATTVEDVKNIGEIISMGDLLQKSDLLSDKLQLGVEGDEEIEIEGEIDAKVDAGIEEDDEYEEEDFQWELESEVEEDIDYDEDEAEEEIEEEDEEEDDGFELDDEYDDDDDGFPEGFEEAYTEEALQEMILEDDMQDSQAVFSDEVPEGIEADEKDDVFIVDEEPEFVVGDIEENIHDGQESSNEFGDLAPENLSQEDVDFDVLDDDPDFGLVVADDEADAQDEPKGDFSSGDVENEASISDDDWDASIRLAQKGLEGTIVGIDEAVADMSEKANWEAAKRLAQVLNQQDDEVVNVDDEEVDMEALGRAAREAVQQFEEQKRKEQDEIKLERKKWENEMRTSADDIDLESLDVDDGDLEEIAKAARAAVEMFEAQRAKTDDSFDFGVESEGKKQKRDSTRAEEDESRFATDEEDLKEIARAARAAVEMFEARQGYVGLEEEFDFDDSSDQNFQTSSTSTEPTVRDWSSLSFTQLKDELKARGLSTRGKKADLISALSEYEASLSAATSDTQGADNIETEDFDESQLFSTSQFDDTIARDWSALTAAQLKDELKARGLSTKGTKADLVAALVESMTNADEETTFEATVTKNMSNMDDQYEELLLDAGVNGAFRDDDRVDDSSLLSFLDTLEPDAVDRDWTALTTSELKDELRALGLSVKGKKSELIDRLIEFEERAEMGDTEDALDTGLIGTPLSSLPEEPSDEALMEIEIEESSLLSGDINDSYDSMSVAQLKDELRKRGLRVGGKKGELIERLRSSES